MRPRDLKELCNEPPTYFKKSKLRQTLRTCTNGNPRPSATIKIGFRGKNRCNVHLSELTLPVVQIMPSVHIQVSFKSSRPCFMQRMFVSANFRHIWLVSTLVVISAFLYRRTFSEYFGVAKYKKKVDPGTSDSYKQRIK